MAKPRIFVSSTYYDLRHVRERIEDFINTMGYESVLFESGDIPFKSDAPLDHSCYLEIESCHMLVLIIGGRYGSPASGEELPKGDAARDKFFEHFNSITKKEYETANSRDIPIFIFVDQGVMSEFQTFKKNRSSTSVNYAHVDSINIFLLLDEILGRSRNNFIRAFARIDDITSWLQDQWAGLFADMLSRQSEQTDIANISSRLEELQDVTASLKNYSEEILKDTLKQKGQKIITEETQRMRDLTIKRFSKNRLIRHLNRFLEKSQTTLIDAFNVLENSSTLEEYLTNLKIEGRRFEGLSESSAAKRDFFKLRRDFVEVDLQKMSIEILELNPTTLKALRNAGIESVSGLERTNLLQLKGIGKSRANEIKSKLWRLTREN